MQTYDFLKNMYQQHQLTLQGFPNIISGTRLPISIITCTTSFLPKPDISGFGRIKITPGGCFCCPPGWEKVGAAAYTYVLFFEPGPYV